MTRRITKLSATYGYWKCPHLGVPGSMMRPTATAYEIRHVRNYSAHMASCAFHRGEKDR